MSMHVSGITDVRETIAALQGELPDINKKVQNGLAMEVRKAEVEEARDSFEGGATPFTVGSIQYQKFGTRRLSSHEGAGVYVMDRFHGGLATYSGADKSYLSVMELGGSPAGPKRSVARFRALGIIPSDYTWVPAREARKDRYGNLRGNDISDMFTSLGIGFVRTENPRYRYIWAGQSRPIGVARRFRRSWRPFLWFIPEPSYEGGNFLWTLTGELAVERHFDRIASFYIDRALR